MTTRGVRVRRFVRGLGLALALATPVAAAARLAAAADDVPPAIEALAAADDAGRKAARAEFLARPDADELVVDWLRDSSKRAKLSEGAATALVDIAAERGIQLANSGLRALLRDASAPIGVRRAAARTLAKTGTVADVAALGDAMPDLPDEASRALAAIGGDAAAGVLRRSMESRPTLEATAALAKLGDGARLEELAAALDDPERRARAAELLRWATGRDLGDDVAAWRAFLSRRTLEIGLAGPDADAAQALVERSAAAARDPSTGPQAAAVLAQIVADPACHVFARAKAALALGLSGTRAHNDVLLAATANGQPGDLRWAAANALARVGDLSCAAPIASMLVHDEDRDRLAAKRSAPRTEFAPVDGMLIRALYRRGVPGAASAAIALLGGEYRTGLHREALFALQEVSAGETFGFQPDAAKAERLRAFARICAWWADARESVRVAPPEADDPGWPAFRKEVDALVTRLGAKKFLDNMRAKAALVLLAEPATPQLVAALDHAELHVRNGAADVMGTTALRRFAPPLAARLAVETNPVARTRLLAALEACGRQRPGNGETTPDGLRAPVRTALGDRILDVRIAAARTLGVVGDATDVARLLAARSDPSNADEAFRFASAGALLLLGDRSAAADLFRALRSDDAALRADAASFLARAGFALHGFEPNAPAAAREESARNIEQDVSAGERR